MRKMKREYHRSAEAGMGRLRSACSGALMCGGAERCWKPLAYRGLPTWL